MYLLWTIRFAFSTDWRQPIGCFILIGHFLQKSPTISGSFAERDLQLQASYAFMPLFILIGHFPQQSPIISGSFAERDLQLKGILCIFATLYQE